VSRAERLALVDRADPVLSTVEQCRLLKVARSTLYYRPAPVSADDLAVMRRMDELHLAWPFAVETAMHSSSRVQVDVSRLRRNDNTPVFCFVDFITQGLGYRIERQCSVQQTLDKFEAGHLLLFVGADRPICPADGAALHRFISRGSRIIRLLVPPPRAIRRLLLLRVSDLCRRSLPIARVSL
jgi:hypothetical protein